MSVFVILLLLYVLASAFDPTGRMAMLLAAAAGASISMVVLAVSAGMVWAYLVEPLLASFLGRARADRRQFQAQRAAP